MLSRLQHNRVASRQCRGDLPCGHQQREVPRDDLAHHTKRLVEVVRHCVVVNLAKAALLRAEGTCVVAEVINGQRDIRGEGFTNRLAVLPGLCHRDLFEVLLHPISNPQQHQRALLHAGHTPFGRGLLRCVNGKVDVRFAAACDLTKDLTGHRGDVVKVFPRDRSDPVAADVVFIALAELDIRFRGSRVGVNSHGRTPLHLTETHASGMAHTIAIVSCMPHCCFLSRSCIWRSPAGRAGNMNRHSNGCLAFSYRRQGRVGVAVYTECNRQPV